MQPGAPWPRQSDPGRPVTEAPNLPATRRPAPATRGHAPAHVPNAPKDAAQATWRQIAGPRISGCRAMGGTRAPAPCSRAMSCRPPAGPTGAARGPLPPAGAPHHPERSRPGARPGTMPRASAGSAVAAGRAPGHRTPSAVEPPPGAATATPHRQPMPRRAACGFATAHRVRQAQACRKRRRTRALRRAIPAPCRTLPHQPCRSRPTIPIPAPVPLPLAIPRPAPSPAPGQPTGRRPPPYPGPVPGPRPDRPGPVACRRPCTLPHRDPRRGQAGARSAAPARLAPDRLCV